MKETFKLANEGIEVVNKDKINRLNYILNEKAEKFKKIIDTNIIHLADIILTINSNKIIDLLKATKQSFIILFQYIFNFEDENYKQNVKDISNKIVEIIGFIINGKVENSINKLKIII